MKNLILALNKANLSDSDMESVLTDFENWVDSRVVRSEQKMMWTTPSFSDSKTKLFVLNTFFYNLLDLHSLN